MSKEPTPSPATPAEFSAWAAEFNAAYAEARAALEAFGASPSDLELLAIAPNAPRLAAVLAHLTPGELHDCDTCPDDEPCPSGGGDPEKRARARSALIALSALVKE